MEQDQCWIQTKRKYSMSNSNNLVNPSNSSSCYGDSWEEQAFAEDAAGASLGGCVWPPRSYSCSFCRREFRSAQALGGHMNVHRKDRARLKESSSPQNEKILYHHHHHELENHLQKPIQGANSLAYNNLLPNSSLCGLVYKTNNPNYDLDFVASTSSPSPSKTLSREETLIPFYDSSTPHKMISPLNSFEPWRNLSGDDRLCPTNFQLEVDNIHEKVSKGILDSRFRGKESNNDDDDEGDVAMSLNLVLCRAHPFMEFESTKEEEDFNCKKRKKIDCSSNQLFSKSSSFDRQQHIQAKMFELSPNSIEELDLELRLGTKSKV